MQFLEHVQYLEPHLEELIRAYGSYIVLVLLGLLLVQTVRLALSRSLASRRVSFHRELGREGEKRARALLTRQGFVIEKEQASGRYEVTVDGEAQVVHLRADFLARKSGRTFVVEVKSGEQSVKVSGRATRRQLLEYHYAFATDGVLLLDMHAKEIRVVTFPEQTRQQRAAG